MLRPIAVTRSTWWPDRSPGRTLGDGQAAERWSERPTSIDVGRMAPSSAGAIFFSGPRHYAAIDALRRPRTPIPRLPPARLLSGFTSFWPDCRRDFSSAFARRFEFRFAIGG